MASQLGCVDRGGMRGADVRKDEDVSMIKKKANCQIWLNPMEGKLCVCMCLHICIHKCMRVCAHGKTVMKG